MLRVIMAFDLYYLGILNLYYNYTNHTMDNSGMSNIV